MQRIAWWACLGLVFLVGCQTEPARRNLGPVPGPALSTRPPPPPVAPAPPPERVTPVPPRGRSTVSTADIVPRGGIHRGQWKVIVVHHSGAANATPQGMDSWHHQRGWSGGLGYDFVIGNGVNYPDGALFVGPRWKAQSTGAHCKSGAGRYFGVWRDSNFFNEHGIGICLIGNFQNDRPTAKQLQTLNDLICVLIQETGISPSQVYGHGEITHKTECPGRYTNMTAIRRTVAASVLSTSANISAGSMPGGLRVAH